MAIVSTKAKGKVKRKFFREVKQELKKVTWTSKSELILCTKIVLIATFLLGMGIYLVDIVIQSGLSSLKLLLRMIGG